MTYAELAAFVARFTSRTDVSGDLASFIAMTEDEFSILRVRQMVKRATASVDAEFAAAPTDFLAERTMQIGDHEVQYVTPETLDAQFERTPARPDMYTVVAGEFRFSPVPDAAYTVELTYYARPAAVTDAVSNWLIEGFGNVYRFGCLWAAATLMQDPRAIAAHRSEFDRAMLALQTSFKDKIGRPLRADPALLQCSGSRSRFLG